MSGILSRMVRPARPMLSAFVDAVEPVFVALAPGARWIAVEVSGDRRDPQMAAEAAGMPPSSGDLAFYRASRRGAVFLGHGSSLPEPVRRAFRSRANAETELRLQADHVVTTQIKVPMEASGFAAQIVASRLDRLTPWRSEKLLHGFHVASKPGGDGQLTVDVVATSREIVAAGVARLAAFGLVPSRVGSAGEPIEERLRIDLLNGENDTLRKTRRRRIAAGTLAVLVLTLAGFLASIAALSMSTSEVADAQAGLDATRRKMVGASGSGGIREREAAMLEAKTPEQASFVLIDRLATILPDTTTLDELDILPQSLRLAGTSTEVSSLVAIIEAEPALSQASFAAPVTRQEDGRDRFDISVIRAGKDGAPAP
ncbi:PilN domain-containing protein [Rhizobium sp. 9140]|uniref:PilN domain-containing protein n=1 Tax=Rhizobium sp. 9140 TaxID=1761900 RepID=UPI000797DB1A|nr:PilN domain-containing protein [Rhizobium sp. 9140]CZT33635.1 general secretion pathway protein L [Rhizobium sp. 9140]